MKAISPFKNIAVVGVGLIGGSIGLGLKKYSRGVSITGIGRNITRLKITRTIGAVDKISLNLKDVRGQDLIILAQPVAVIKKTLSKISKFLKQGAVIIDVGGTKEGIIKEAHKRLPSGVHFIGTHPLAGSEKMGAKAASPDLFCGTKCVIIRGNDKNALKKVARIFKILGAEVITMSAREHDEFLAAISHLPHLVAQALVGTVGREEPKALRVASSGFCDTTRIAQSSAEIWRDIFIENKKNILKILTAYEKELKKIRCLINKNKKNELVSYLTKIKKIRNKLEFSQ